MELVSALVGGLLAGLAGWFVQNRIEARREARQRDSFLVTISDDLENSIRLYGDLAEGWKNSSVIFFNIIQEIRESRATYINLRSLIVTIDDAELRNQITTYYNKSWGHLLQMENAQQRVYAIEQKYQFEVQQRQLRYPDGSDTEHHAIVRDAMQAETEEIEYWKSTLPNLVLELTTNYKDQASKTLGLIQQAK